MICKEDFVFIMDNLQRSVRAFTDLENALGGIDLTCTNLMDYTNCADNIALLLLELNFENDDTMSAFMESIWYKTTCDNGVILSWENGNEIIIREWEEFYDFWTGPHKYDPKSANVYYPRSRGTYSWD